MIGYNNEAPKAVNNVGQFGATEGSIGAYKSAAEYASDAKYWALLSQTKYSSVEEILDEVERLYTQGRLLEEDIKQLKKDFEAQEQILLGLIQTTGTAIDNTNAATELSKEATQKVLEQLDIISNMTVQTTLLPPGSLATGSYDNATGVFAFGIPEGKPGRDGTDGTISDIGSVPVGVPVVSDYGFYVDKDDGGLYRAGMSDIANLIPSVRSVSINGGAEQTGSVVFDSVSTFNGRKGAVVSQSGDYSVDQVTGAAKSGANSDITSLSGLTTSITIEQGGTGATSASSARTNLGLGPLATESVVPISNGGTGATSASSARTNLGLGLVSTENIIPIAKGGTGSTSAENARIALVAAKSGANSDITSFTNYVTFTQPVAVGTPTSSSEAATKGYVDSISSDTLDYSFGGTGAVNRKIRSRLQDYVSVLDFGADPTGTSDSSTAFQNACDTGKTVFVPKGHYIMGKSLVLKRSVSIIGEGNDGLINKAASFINMSGDFPFITNWTVTGDANSFFQLHVEKLFIQYNPTSRPTVSAGNSNKIAFYFKSPVDSGNSLEFSSIKDVTVLGAWYAFYDISGTYMTELKRVEARDCRIGFVKSTGTTMTLENCYATGCITGYNFGALSTVVMTNCAMDNSPISTANGSVSSSGLALIGVRSFMINGFDAEVNRIATDGGDISSLFLFDSSVGSINGFTGLRNDLVSEGAGVSGTSTLFRAVNNSSVQITGSELEFFRNESIRYSGDGYGISILTDATSNVGVSYSSIQSPYKVTGTPLLLASSQGNVAYTNSKIGGSVYGGYIETKTSKGLQIPRVFSTEGTAVVTADVEKGITSLTGIGCYLVSAWAEGSGTNYSATSLIVRSGGGPEDTSLTPLHAGAFLSITASGDTVGVISKGSSTINWRYTKL